MIFDSHAHYAYGKFDNDFPYLDRRDGSYALSRGARGDVLEAIARNGVVGWLEPSIALADIPKQLAIAEENAGKCVLALGVHPTRCDPAQWKDRKSLAKAATQRQIVAIGETGLDYHLEPNGKARRLQKKWFRYQLRLAHKCKLPVILHIRMADKDARKILQRYRRRLHGGVVHCFAGDYETARFYLNLGLKLGIGGTLLSEKYGKELQETVKRVPLSSVLVETDAPFILPDTPQLQCSKKQKQKLCNTSCILPDVIERIAQLRGEDEKTVEDRILRNTLSLFRLPIGGEG